jgi:hypothetical protein
MVTMPKDLTGKRFGLLLVIGQAGKNKHGQPKWLCQCDCGKTKVVLHEMLVKSTNNSCRCKRREVKNLLGQRFGRLVVVSLAERNRHHQPQWLCQCDCGQSVIIRGCSLTSQNTRSCGCLLREVKVKHGMSQSPTYQSWSNMIARCTYPNDSEWQRYGGRGIKVGERWLNFENFLLDMGQRPEGTTLDRLDPNADYCSQNCRWATPTEQANNRRNSHFLTFDGVTKTLSEWATVLGINRTTLSYRLKMGWSLEQAFTQPVNHKFCLRQSQ